MLVRTATRTDIDTIVTLLRNYSQCSPVAALRDQHDEHYVRQLITGIIVGQGRIWIAEDSAAQPMGMLMAIRMPSIWNPNITTLTELAFWVEPAARNSSTGYRLLKSYEQYAETESVNHYTISRLDSSQFDPARRGYDLLEQTYIKQLG
jgi:N-acetylglutamate synthase-like GNAT family acetyltransferase